VRPIDVRHLGHHRVICAWQVGDVLIDPGPESCLDTLLAALDGERPRALLLTHIHLDHAGASGTLVRRWPDLEVYVHEVGAPHLADPSKLVSSAQRLYGEGMQRLWGEVAAVPRETLRVLSGGETVHGFRVAYTPGHASHHVSYLHEDTGRAFVGDVAGVRIPPSRLTIAPTPPPDIDVEAWGRSLDTVAGWDPSGVCLTHFGLVEEVGAQLEAVRASLSEWAPRARDLTEEGFIAALRRELADRAGTDTAAIFEQAAPPDQLFKGLARYWRKRAERAERAEPARRE
jgi:glyoxylase-like metal-dependent hydrolase (beta-lactamase superfamily II)